MSSMRWKLVLWRSEIRLREVMAHLAAAKAAGAGGGGGAVVAAVVGAGMWAEGGRSAATGEDLAQAGVAGAGVAGRQAVRALWRGTAAPLQVHTCVPPTTACLGASHVDHCKLDNID